MSDAENAEERPDDAGSEGHGTAHEAPPRAEEESDESNDEAASGEPEPPYYSPGCPSTTEEEEAGAGEEEVDTGTGWAFAAWLLYGASAATVLIPLAFLLLPLITHSVAAREDPGPATVGIPCRRPTPQLPRDPGSINFTDNVSSDPSMAAGKTVITTYCIYNNSRYLNVLGHEFLPGNIPLSACPNLIYWSMSITGGKVTSRQEAFDTSYGLYSLRQRLSQGNSGISFTLIMTLGGYPEDSADFHQLGPDYLYRHRLVADVYRKILKYDLNGVNIHWVRDTESCESGIQNARWKTLATFLFDIKTLFRINRDDFLATVIMDPLDRRPDEATYHSLARTADIIFFTTHLIQQRDNTLWGSCGKYSELVEDIAHYVTTRPASETAHICYSETLALYAWTWLNGTSPLPAQGAPKKEGSISVPEMCGSAWKVKDLSQNYNACQVFEVTRSDVIYIARYKAITEWKKAMDCQLLFDMDFDNIFKGCGATKTLFLMLRYYAFHDDELVDWTTKLPATMLSSRGTTKNP